MSKKPTHTKRLRLPASRLPARPFPRPAPPRKAAKRPPPHPPVKEAETGGDAKD